METVFQLQEPLVPSAPSGWCHFLLFLFLAFLTSLPISLFKLVRFNFVCELWIMNIFKILKIVMLNL